MKKSIIQIAIGSLILGFVMDIVFFLVGRFDMTVVLGTIVGIICADLNFIFLGITVSKTLNNGKTAYMGVSYLLRMAFIGAVVVFSIKSPYINYVSAAIPLVFPRVIITVLKGIIKK